MIQANLRQQPLKSESILRRAAALTQIIINDQHAICRPPVGFGSLRQAVLQRRRFTVLQHLLGRGLPHIHDRQTVQMLGLNFASPIDDHSAVCRTSAASAASDPAFNRQSLRQITHGWPPFAAGEAALFEQSSGSTRPGLRVSMLREAPTKADSAGPIEDATLGAGGDSVTRLSHDSPP